MTEGWTRHGSRRAALRDLLTSILTTALLGLALGCGESRTETAPAGRFRLTTTRLCPLVPGRDAAAGMYPQTPPARVFGTDLGWTYERNGTITMLFGDSWQRIDICPIQLNGDDSLATLSIPPNDWPGFAAHEPLPDSACPQLTFANNEAGTAFAPIELHRWDGVLVPMGPLNVPMAAFHDGQREWGIFIVAGVFVGGSGQPCSQSEATNGSPCPADLSAQAADLVCGPIVGNPLCLDPSNASRLSGLTIPSDQRQQSMEITPAAGLSLSDLAAPSDQSDLAAPSDQRERSIEKTPAAGLAGPRAACGVGPAQCIDPTSTKQGNGRQAYYVHIAERVGPTSYISRAMFLTNKYLNLSVRAVRAFDPDDPSRRDYTPGTGALLMWGRPGFDNQNDDGEEPPYFMYHPLPFEVVGDRIDFQPRYLRGVSNGVPAFSANQADATPLYTGEFDPVNHAALSYLPQFNRWLMIYGGSIVNSVSQTQPIPGAMYARFSPQPWGPWTDATTILTDDQVAQDLVCGTGTPPGCLAAPVPPIRPACIEAADPHGGGILYGANIIDALTRPSRADTDGGPAADVFWNVSTWHPYSVVLIKTHIELE